LGWASLLASMKIRIVPKLWKLGSRFGKRLTSMTTVTLLSMSSSLSVLTGRHFSVRNLCGNYSL
jgi:hypothetical protein